MFNVCCSYKFHSLQIPLVSLLLYPLLALGLPLYSHSESLGLFRSYRCNPLEAYWSGSNVWGREVFYNLIKSIFGGPVS